MFLSCLTVRTFLNYNRGMDSYFSCFLDDIKMFKPSKEGASTVQAWQSDTDRCERTKLHIDFRLIWTPQDRQQPKITIPRAAYLKMNGRLTLKKPQTSAKQAEKETERKCLWQKRPGKKLNTKAWGRIINKDEIRQMRVLSEKRLP